MARKYQVKTHRSTNFSITFPDELKNALKKIDSPEIRTKVLRSAAYAGAKIYYDEMRRIVPVKEGELHNAIYHFHDESRSSDKRQTYVIGPNKVKAPHWYWIEFGHWLYNRYADGKWLRSKRNQNARVGKPEPGGWGDVHSLPGARDVPMFVPGKQYIWRTYDAKRAEVAKAVVRRAQQRFAELMKGGT
jgi:hypothetical protein